MKKSFILFSTIILVFIFSVIAVNLYELKSISSINIQNQYKYIQAKNHLNFLEDYIKTQSSLETLEKIQIENEQYEIIALINKLDENNYEIELSVKALGFNVKVYRLLTMNFSI